MRADTVPVRCAGAAVRHPEIRIARRRARDPDPANLLAVPVAAIRLAAAVALGALTACAGGPGDERPPLQRATVTERLGAAVPADLRFTDTDGRAVRLGDLIDDRVPTLLVPAYYRCRTLCPLVLAGAARALHEAGIEPGTGFRAITVSIDPRDSPADARTKQAHTLRALGRPRAAKAWPFLVGDSAAIRALTDAIGFGYAYDPDTDQYAHPAVAVALSPGGRIAGYVYGVEPPAEAVSAALAAARDGRTLPAIERMVLRCFRYVPALRQHAGIVRGMLWGGALLTLAGLGTLLARLLLAGPGHGAPAGRDG